MRLMYNPCLAVSSFKSFISRSLYFPIVNLNSYLIYTCKLFFWKAGMRVRVKTDYIRIISWRNKDSTVKRLNLITEKHSNSDAYKIRIRIRPTKTGHGSKSDWKQPDIYNPNPDSKCLGHVTPRWLYCFTLEFNFENVLYMW